MGKEFEEILLAIGPGSQAEKTRVDNEIEYEVEIKRIYDAYTTLLNTYGESSGEVTEERSYPKPRFSFFRVASKRKCPEITEVVKDAEESMRVILESEHTDHLSKPYDPTILKEIFPSDGLRLELKKNSRLSPSQWQENTYYISLSGVDHLVLQSSDFPLDNSISNFINSRKQRATWSELEMLMLLHPFLETRYKEMQSTSTPKKQIPAQKLGFLRRLLPGK